MLNINLNDTVELMNSSDYRERFIAEYVQTKIRYEKLKSFNTRIAAANATKGKDVKAEMPKHDCPDKLLLEQQAAMGKYLHTLEVRAVIEKINLSEAELYIMRSASEMRCKAENCTVTSK